MKKTPFLRAMLLLYGSTLLILSISCKKDTIETDTVTDFESNVYHTVTIGTQVWMKENLKTSRLNDGTAISIATGNISWKDLITPGYCWYNNDAANKNINGALYNWYAVNSGKLAPQGWHVPTDEEWSTLINYLGGTSIAGGKMKSIGSIQAGTGLWEDPNTGATNESGFTGIPGGSRFGSGNFIGIGKESNFWSSSEYGAYVAYGQSLFYNNAAALRLGADKNGGLSVRCVRDN